MPSLKVSGMSCQHCVKSVTTALNELDTIKSVSVDLDSGLVTYETDGNLDVNTVKKTILGLGFTPED